MDKRTVEDPDIDPVLSGLAWLGEHRGWAMVIILGCYFGHEAIADILTGAWDGLMVLLGWM